MTKNHIEVVAELKEFDFELIALKPFGSRVHGGAKSDSDLDIRIEYVGDLKEDRVFNILNCNEDRLFIEGIPVDFSPVRIEKDA